MRYSQFLIAILFFFIYSLTKSQTGIDSNVRWSFSVFSDFYYNPGSISPDFNEFDNNFVFANSAGFKTYKELNKGGRFILGHSYFYFAKSEKNTIITKDCNNYYNDISIEQEVRYRINAINLLFGYQFRPLTKRGNWSLQFMNHLGLNFLKYQERSNVGFHCMRNYDYNNSQLFLGYHFEVVFLNSVLSYNRIDLNLNYGLSLQLSYYYQICINLGLELKFKNGK